MSFVCKFVILEIEMTLSGILGYESQIMIDPIHNMTAQEKLDNKLYQSKLLDSNLKALFENDNSEISKFTVFLNKTIQDNSFFNAMIFNKLSIVMQNYSKLAIVAIREAKKLFASEQSGGAEIQTASANKSDYTGLLNAIIQKLESLQTAQTATATATASDQQQQRGKMMYLRHPKLPKQLIATTCLTCKNV
jgi:hypothetical protein